MPTETIYFVKPYLLLPDVVDHLYVSDAVEMQSSLGVDDVEPVSVPAVGPRRLGSKERLLAEETTGGSRGGLSLALPVPTVPVVIGVTV